LAGLLRPGNANSNTAADHITVLGWALESLPPAYRPDPDDPGAQQILVRSDSAGATHAFADARPFSLFLGLRDLKAAPPGRTAPPQSFIAAGSQLAQADTSLRNLIDRRAARRHGSAAARCVPPIGRIRGQRAQLLADSRRCVRRDMPRRHR
jgi:hypothetical protein